MATVCRRERARHAAGVPGRGAVRSRRRLPLALPTFIGAYVPIIGAFVAGLAAVLLALVALGPPAAPAVAAAVWPYNRSRATSSNRSSWNAACTCIRSPVAILLAVTVGPELAGIIGAIIATPIVGRRGGRAALPSLRATCELERHQLRTDP